LGLGRIRIMGEVVYGGPYTYEVDAIRDERVRAAAEGREPDFNSLFQGVAISQGAVNVLNDIKNPEPPFLGNHVTNAEPPEDYDYPVNGGTNTVDKEEAE
jgi:hypothetical protein